MPKAAERVQVAPLLLGPENAEAATGANWRFLRSHAQALGVRVLSIGRKSFVRADEYLAALEQHAGAPGADEAFSEESPAPADPAAAVRSLLGKKRREVA